jgi:hypothetical protein
MVGRKVEMGRERQAGIVKASRCWEVVMTDLLLLMLSAREVGNTMRCLYEHVI